MFVLLRELERWLHQHVFKVGWLLTHNYETTTILYYTFFLPGVILYEVVYWLAAGILNVRAERAIQWPQKQEIGELKLEFVKISNKANRLQRAIIAISPLIVGMIIIWYIANNIFDISSFLAVISTGNLNDVAAGFRLLTTAPDFWLWVYISFTISNTMFPNSPKDLQGWWIVGGAVVVIVIVLSFVGLGNQISGAVALPIAQVLSVLEGMLLMMIGINFLMTVSLGIIESSIEYVTGHSATFKNGKMITMTRDELREQREQERKKAAQARQRSKPAPADTGPPSIYKFTFQTPGAPGQEPVSQVASAVLEEKPAQPPLSIGRKPDVDMLVEGDKPQDIPPRPEPRIRVPGMSRDTETSADEPVKRPALPASKTPGEPGESSDVKPSAPTTTRPGMPSLGNKPITDQKSTVASSPTNPTARMMPKPADDTEVDKTSTAPKPPAGAVRPTPFKSPVPSESTDDDEDKNTEEQTTSVRSSSRLPHRSAVPLRPTAPVTPTDDDDDDDEQDENNERSALRSRMASNPARPAPFNRPKTTSDDDETEDDDDEELGLSALRSRMASNPARPAPFNRPETTSDDDEANDEQSEMEDAFASLFGRKPGASPSGNRPSTFAADDDEDDDEDEEIGGRSLFRSGSRPNPFKTSLGKRADDDDIIYEDVDDDS